MYPDRYTRHSLDTLLTEQAPVPVFEGLTPEAGQATMDVPKAGLAPPERDPLHRCDKRRKESNYEESSDGRDRSRLGAGARSSASRTARGRSRDNRRHSEGRSGEAV